MKIRAKRILVFFMTVLFFLPLFGRDFIHVFTSKGAYETCEDLWFKCIEFDDSSKSLSGRSHTAYVEIVDPSDSVVWKEKYRMKNGMCDGHAYIGEDWRPGEYRMFVHTRYSLDKRDSVIYPKRLLVVRELPEVKGFVSSAKERLRYIHFPDTSKGSELNVTLTLDSTEYHTRSTVNATVRITDATGNPVQAVLAISVADALYSYPPSDVDIQSQIFGLKLDSVKAGDRKFKPFLSDAVVSGRLRSKSKNNTLPLEGQFINVFDDIAEKGALNITNTYQEGYFEVSPEMGSSLGGILLLKPLVNEDMKPKLELDNPFDEISRIRKNAIERDFPILRNIRSNEIEDTLDYKGRRVRHLDEVEVKAKGSLYPKRNKVMGFLDSLALNLERAWVCGCRGGGGEKTYLNDYIEGYTHHPDGIGEPKKISKPKLGGEYELIKYERGSKNYYVTDIKWMRYMGPRYSEEELLQMEGLWRGDGYYPKHRFRMPQDEDFVEEDFRNTLLWLPQAQTDNNGEFSIVIPTSDIKSTFKIQILILTDNVSDMKTITEYFRII